ncbi:MAG: Rrf2 family transcriptional regulator [bacterium]|nr:Rrf2 family transcriptional regulator [bacterium]
MKLLTRDTDYAVRALIFICKAGRRREGATVTADEIIKALKLPKALLRKSLQTLSKNKILISGRGKRGGFSLSKHPSKINIVDIITIFQGPVNFTNCLLRNTPCPNRRMCKVRKKILNLSKYVSSALEKITLSSLS